MFTLIALIASFTIETNKKVSTSGILPEGAAAEYVCTGRKGQMTKGQSATLTLTGWQNTEIQSVRLSIQQIRRCRYSANDHRRTNRLEHCR